MGCDVFVVRPSRETDAGWSTAGAMGGGCLSPRLLAHPNLHECAAQLRWAVDRRVTTAPLASVAEYSADRGLQGGSRESPVRSRTERFGVTRSSMRPECQRAFRPHRRQGQNGGGYFSIAARAGQSISSGRPATP